MYELVAETVVDIEVLDVNDNIPFFPDIKKGSVLENEPRGVPVMQVRAIDADGTTANNQILKLRKLHSALQGRHLLRLRVKVSLCLALNTISRL